MGGRRAWAGRQHSLACALALVSGVSGTNRGYQVWCCGAVVAVLMVWLWVAPPLVGAAPALATQKRAVAVKGASWQLQVHNGGRDTRGAAPASFYRHIAQA